MSIKRGLAVISFVICWARLRSREQTTFLALVSTAVKQSCSHTLSTLENSWELGMNEDLPLSVSLIQKYRLWKIAVNLLFLIITFTVFDVTFRWSFSKIRAREKRCTTITSFPWFAHSFRPNRSVIVKTTLCEDKNSKLWGYSHTWLQSLWMRRD